MNGIGDRERSPDIDSSVVTELRDFNVFKAHFGQQHGNKVFELSCGHGRQSFQKFPTHTRIVLFDLSCEASFVPLAQCYVAVPEADEARLFSTTLAAFDFRDDLGVHGGFRGFPAGCQPAFFQGFPGDFPIVHGLSVSELFKHFLGAVGKG